MVTATQAFTNVVTNIEAFWTGMFGLPMALFWLLVVGMPLIYLLMSVRRRKEGE